MSLVAVPTSDKVMGWVFELASAEFRACFPNAREDGIIFPLPPGARLDIPLLPGQVLRHVDLPGKPDPGGHSELDVPPRTLAYFGAKRPGWLAARWTCWRHGHTWLDRSVPAANLQVRRCACCLLAQLHLGNGLWRRMPPSAYAACQSMMSKLHQVSSQSQVQALLPPAETL